MTGTEKETHICSLQEVTYCAQSPCDQLLRPDDVKLVCLFKMDGQGWTTTINSRFVVGFLTFGIQGVIIAKISITIVIFLISCVITSSVSLGNDLLHVRVIVSCVYR